MLVDVEARPTGARGGIALARTCPGVPGGCVRRRFTLVDVVIFLVAAALVSAVLYVLLFWRWPRGLG